MTTPTILLIASNVILWIVLIVMGCLVYALTRQIGILYERVAPAGALSINKSVAPGEPAPAMALQTLDNRLVDIAGPSVEKKSQLLFFLSPTCPVCKTLLPSLKSSAKAEQDWLNVVLCSDGMELDHKGFTKDHEIEHFDYVVSELLGKSYGVSKLPYAVVIDEAGFVASMGIINSREHLESLFEAKERNIASIQDYLNNQTTANPSGATEVKV